jgi:hypothetical protein
MATTTHIEETQMTFEEALLTQVPHGELTRVRLCRGDGRTVDVLVRIEHNRVYLYRKEKPYATASYQAWVERRVTGDEMSFFACRQPGESAFAQCEDANRQAAIDVVV